VMDIDCYITSRLCLHDVSEGGCTPLFRRLVIIILRTILMYFIRSLVDTVTIVPGIFRILGHYVNSTPLDLKMGMQPTADTSCV
jgi:hypothetical protein